MSGTAHASWRFGQFLGNHVAGVIAASGGVQNHAQGPPGEASFAYYGITGTADFNYNEMMEIERHLLDEGIDHRMVIFEGRHGWPPHEYTNRALDWMELQAVRRGLAPNRPELIDAELAGARQAAATATDPLEKLRRTRDVVRDFGGLREVAPEIEAVRRLRADPEVEKRRAQEKKLAKAENTYLAMRYQRWVPELRKTGQRIPTVKEALYALRVESLRKRAAATEDPPDAYSAQRLLEDVYVGVAFYLPREFEEAGDSERRIRCFEIAVAIYPQEARGHWRLATAYAEAGRDDKALETLRTATSFGNVDLQRLETDPTWESLRKRLEWAELLASIEDAQRGYRAEGH
jgi:tetratricopeptide (TPR) repeat protein